MVTMGLHFIFGRAGTGKTERCCREIRDYVLSGPDRKAFLLVPDQGTYTAEYRLAESFPGGGFTNVTVCGFSRLAYRVFQELHSPVSDALSPLGQQIILRRLMEEHKKELKMIYKAASHPHFPRSLPISSTSWICSWYRSGIWKVQPKPREIRPLAGRWRTWPFYTAPTMLT